MSQAEQLQELSAWLHLPKAKERYHYLAAHLELLASGYDYSLTTLIDLYCDQPDEQKRLRTEQHVLHDARARGETAEAVRQAYINEYGGLTTDLPPWLEWIERMLCMLPASRGSERICSASKLLLRNAIEDVQTSHSLPSEVLAELQYRLGHLFAQDLPGRSRQLFAKVTAYYEAALLIYTRDRYPKQYAKVQLALGDAYRACQAEDQWDTLLEALRYYEAALQLYTDCVSLS